MIANVDMHVFLQCAQICLCCYSYLLFVRDEETVSKELDSKGDQVVVCVYPNRLNFSVLVSIDGCGSPHPMMRGYFVGIRFSSSILCNAEIISSGLPKALADSASASSSNLLRRGAMAMFTVRRKMTPAIAMI